MRSRDVASFAAGVSAAMAAGLLGVGLLVRPARVAGGGLAENEERPLPPASHEAGDVGLSPLLLGGFCVLLALGGAMALAAWLYPGSVTDNGLSAPLPRYPQPRLQTAPAVDMATMRAEQLHVLNELAWVDRARGTVRIPIDDAMRAVAREGIPDWPAAPRVQR